MTTQTKRPGRKKKSLERQPDAPGLTSQTNQESLKPGTKTSWGHVDMFGFAILKKCPKCNLENPLEHAVRGVCHNCDFRPDPY